MNTLSDLVSETLKKYPDHILIADDENNLSGTDIALRLDKIEEQLKSSTLENSLVGICFPNHSVLGLALLGVLRSKRIPVILSYADLLQNPEMWLGKCSMDLLLTTPELEEKVYHRVNAVALYPDGAPAPMKKMGHALITNRKIPKGTGLVLYTSGSTGDPKGICVPELGITMTSTYLQKYFSLGSHTVSPIVLPICHSMALNTQFFPTFFSGGKSVFFNSRLEMNRLFRRIKSVDGNFISMIGEVLRVCWDEMRHKKLTPNENVKHVQLAGGIISEKHLEMASALFPKAIIHKGYGLTEAIRVTMINHLHPEFLDKVVGSPLDFQEVSIRLPDGTNGLPHEQGEIFVKGPNVMLGILGKETPHLTWDGFLATGDIGSMDENGQLSVHGRKDSVFKINGVKVSGLEIEKLACRVTDYVRDAKCILVFDKYRNRNKMILFLEISKDSQTLFFQNYFEIFHKTLWKDFKNLAYFPKDIIITSKLPRTNNGKLATKGLHDLWENERYHGLESSSQANFAFYQEDEEHSQSFEGAQ